MGFFKMGSKNRVKMGYEQIVENSWKQASLLGCRRLYLLS